MYFEEEKGTFQFVSGLVIGALVGAGVALMLAPTTGKRTRRKMLQRVIEGRQELGDRVEDWADELGTRLRRVRRRHRRA
jgi:gas vesicle protein